MSWDVKLINSDTRKPVVVPRHEEDGTYAMGGVDVANLNVTYNYSEHFTGALGFSFWDLHDMSAERAISFLRSAVVKLGIVRHHDYWKPTPGNAGYALNILLQWARFAVDNGVAARFEVR